MLVWSITSRASYCIRLAFSSHDRHFDFSLSHTHMAKPTHPPVSKDYLSISLVHVCMCVAVLFTLITAHHRRDLRHHVSHSTIKILHRYWLILSELSVSLRVCVCVCVCLQCIVHIYGLPDILNHLLYMYANKY